MEITRDLGAAARIARHGADLDDAVIDFRHFLREQAHHELRMRAREENLRPARFAAHVVDIGADAIAGAEALARDHLVAAHDAFGAAEIDDDGAELRALDDAVHDLADAVLVFVVLALALGVAHLLHDHLLGVLRVDAVEIDRRQRLGDDVADLGGGIARARVGQADLDLVVVDQLDDVQIARDMRLAGLGIDLDLDLVLAAVVRLGGALHRLFHRGEHDLLVDRLVARDRVGDLQEFEPVGGNSVSHSLVLLALHCARLRAFKSSCDELVGQHELGFRDLRGTESCTRCALRLDHDVVAVEPEQACRETACGRRSARASSSFAS